MTRSTSVIFPFISTRAGVGIRSELAGVEMDSISVKYVILFSGQTVDWRWQAEAEQARIIRMTKDNSQTNSAPFDRPISVEPSISEEYHNRDIYSLPLGKSSKQTWDRLNTCPLEKTLTLFQMPGSFGLSPRRKKPGYTVCILPGRLFNVE